VISILFFWSRETTTHLFFECSVATCLWSWISSYNNSPFLSSTVIELWFLDACFPFKNKEICEVIRGTTLCEIWKERNRLISKGLIVKV
jgi:hypothetical protein